MKPTKRYFILFLISIMCFFLQCTILRKIALASVSPNLLLILPASIGYLYGSREGMFIGFCCGILIDLFYGNFIGLYALLYLYIGYLNGYFRDFYFEKGLRTPLIFIGLSDLFYGLAEYVLFFLLRGKFNFGYYLTHIILPELVYTMILAVPVFFALFKHAQRRK